MHSKSSRPRILVVAQDFPWPAIGGSLQRLSMVIDELAELGDIDLFALRHPRREGPFQVHHDAVVRHRTAVLPEPDLRLRNRPRWLWSGLPMELATRDVRQVRSAFDAWVRPSYDLVWISKVPTWQVVGRPALGPTVVDADDLEDRKILAGLESQRTDRGGRSAVHFRLAAAQLTLNARRWERVQRSAADGVAAVTLCSELDVARSGLPNARVLRNGYVDPERPAGLVGGDRPPTVLLQGVLYYAPNTDAATWLATTIAPALRRLVPDAVVRLVGDTNPTVDALHDPPRVTVTGFVTDIAVELSGADLVAVPLRSGSGTRVKVLEAFAHRLPVVSTTLGAEGLGAEDGVHVLLADDADAFARACARVLTDAALRARMTAAAHALFLRDHTRAAGRRSVHELVAPLVGNA